MGILNIVICTLVVALLITRGPFPDPVRNSVSAKALVSLIILEGVAWTSWRILIWPKFLSPLRHLPEPKGGSFLMGQYKRIISEPSGAPMRDWLINVPNEGLIRYNSAFNIERVIPTSPKALAEVMTHKSYEFIKPPMLIQGLRMILGNGILFAEGDEHKRQRKHLSPAFNFRAVKNLYPVFWDVAKSMISAIDNSTGRGNADGSNESHVVEVRDWSSRATLDIIGLASNGQSFHAIDDTNHLLYRTYQSIFKPPRWRRLIALLSLVVPFWLLRRLQVQRSTDVGRAADIIKENCRRMIAQKRSGTKDGVSSSSDIISTAMQSGLFGDEDLVNQMMTFLAAGHETTSSALQWAIYQLCKSPHVQTLLRKELIAAADAGKLPDIRNKDGTVCAEDIERLPYLSATCQEVLRIWAPVPMTMRIASKNSTILGHTIPKGTTVVIAPAAINTHPEFWGSDANEFKPERWLAEGKANSGGATSAQAFLTFLSGPRSCIGQAFAKAEFAVLLAAWVMAFETTLEDDSQEVEIQGGITIRPKGGLRCRITRLDKNML